MLQIGKQLTTEQRLSKAVVDIMGKQKYVALAGILMIGNRSIVDDIPTACTDGKSNDGESFRDSELRIVPYHCTIFRYAY